MFAAPSTQEECSSMSIEFTSVCQALLESPYRSLRCVSCELVRDTLVLRGTVETFYLKQQAQTMALRSAATLPVRNEIHVTRS